MSIGVVFTAFACVLAVNARQCATPESKEGACMDLENCPRLKSLIDKREWSQEDFKFYVRSHCSGNDTKVCCQTSNKTKPFKLPEPPIILDDRFHDPSTAECGQTIDDPYRIIGPFASLGEFPWMALLKFKSAKGEGYACGGALINRKYVVTAAHCFLGNFGAPFSVTLGEHDVNSPQDCDYFYTEKGECAGPIQQIPIEKYILHPDYSKKTPGKPNDIALIRLKSAANYTDYLQPICLPDESEMKELLELNKRMFVAGWGDTQNHGAQNIKRKAAVPIIDLNLCKKKKSYPLSESQMCAGGGKEDSCSGDSGGPLMGFKISNDFKVIWYMVGVVSIGPTKCASPDSPGVYTNVVPYLNWIKNNIQP